MLLFVCSGLNEARVKEFSVCPEGGALLLTGTNGYLHLLTLKVTLLLLLFVSLLEDLNVFPVSESTV